MVDVSVDSFKSKLVGGGARPNLFRVIVNFPPYAQGDVELSSFMCKKATFPASTTGVVEVNFRGRKLPYEGDRTYEAVTLTFINDVNHPIREAFIRWKNEMSQHSGNTGLSNPSEYTVDVIIEQLSKGGDVVVTHELIGAWPLNVGNIELDYGTNDTIEEFTVEFRYLYWRQNGVTQ